MKGDKDTKAGEAAGRSKGSGAQRGSAGAASGARSARGAEGARSAKAARSAKGAARGESATARKARALEILGRLREAYPDAACSLEHRDPYQLLVATILSAQCTDERVNVVTPALFARYPTPEDLADARVEELEELIRSTGFFHNKAKSLLGMANGVVERHGGRIPDDMDALTALPGVGRKTANVVLGNAFHRNEGIVVDTHVRRLSQRLGLSGSDDPEQIERDLMALIPRDDWTLVSHLLIDHGRAVCRAMKPRCGECGLAGLCPSAFLV